MTTVAEREQRQVEIAAVHARLTAAGRAVETHRQTIANATYLLERAARERAELSDALARAILDFPV